MIIDLSDTTSSAINAKLVQARRSIGSPATGMVLTLVIFTDERDHYDAMKAAIEAAREHPSRVLVVIGRPENAWRRGAQLDAEIRLGGESGPGETVLLRLHGELAHHADNVVLPLLLPDAPVVTWWPGQAPPSLGASPLGKLSQRRISDSAAAARPDRELSVRAATYVPGDTDLAWTRLTPWRSLLAAALDQRYAPITGVRIGAEHGNPSAVLLAAWLEDRLDVSVEVYGTSGPGLTEVALHTEDGPIALQRSDGRLATYVAPGQPDRRVALKRRDTSELIAEELRRLDPDDVFEATLHYLSKRSLTSPAPAFFPPAPVVAPEVSAVAVNAGSETRTEDGSA